MRAKNVNNIPNVHYIHAAMDMYDAIINDETGLRPVSTRDYKCFVINNPNQRKQKTEKPN